jgi:hypothetical protein
MSRNSTRVVSRFGQRLLDRRHRSLVLGGSASTASGRSRRGPPDERVARPVRREVEVQVRHVVNETYT